MKTCTNCKQIKPATFEYFNYGNKRTQRLESWCRDCRRQKTRTWFKTNDESVKQKRRTEAEANRLLVLQHYSRSPIPFCWCCNESALQFLAIDHMNGNGREERKQYQSSTSFYKNIIARNFPKGYRVLCHNCNSSYGLYGYCPHKTPEVSPWSQ